MFPDVPRALLTPERVACTVVVMPPEIDRRVIIIEVECTLFDPEIDPYTVADAVFQILSEYSQPGENWPDHVSIDGTEVRR